MPGVAWRNDALSSVLEDDGVPARCLVGFLGHPQWLWIVYEVCDAGDDAWRRAVTFYMHSKELSQLLLSPEDLPYNVQE